MRLTNTDQDALRLVWLNSHQIIGNYSHGMIVDGENVHSSRRAVDQSQQMLLLGSEGRLEVGTLGRHRVMAMAIDDDAVRLGECPRGDLLLVNDKRRIMNIILDQHWAKINIPRGTGGSVDDQGSGETVGVLECVMGVVPGMAILQGLEFVGEGIALGNRALCDAVHAVHLVGVELGDSMPMDGGAVLLVVVLHVDNKLVAPARLDEWSGKRAIENFTACLVEAVCVELWWLP